MTGATDGVGRVVAKALGKDGWRVLVHGRDRERGEALVQEIEQAGGSATFLQADLASLAEVRRLADEVRKATDRLDLLINNAGIGTAGDAPGRQTSADGHELRFAVNYLAGFLLDPSAAAAAQGERAGAHRQRLLGRPAGDRLLRRHADPAATAASPPTARASWRRSCSPSISPRSCRARA